MAAKKLSRKELKKPDAFIEEGQQVVEWMQKRPALISGVVAIVLIAGVVALVGNRLTAKHEEKAEQALGAAIEIASRPVGQQEQPEPGEQTFATQKDKDQALVQSLEAFRKQYPGTRSAAIAALTLAQAELRLGQADPALGHFQEFLRNTPPADPLRLEALEGEGYAYEAKNQLDDALKTFQQMADGSKSGFLAGMGQLHQARILERQNKKEEAAKILAQIPIQYPGSAAAHAATERLNALALQGVKVPQVKAPAAITLPGQGA